MKIRIKGNSVRLRLTKSEVSAFLTHKEISESTNFGTGQFVYSLKISESCEGLDATFGDNQICINLSPLWADKWQDEKQIGFTKTIKFGDQELHIKVEKDFVCLDETDEDQSDNYPNPRLQ